MNAVVFDNGSQTTRVGFALQGTPTDAFPTKVGRWRSGDMTYVGDEAVCGKGGRNFLVKYPVRDGVGDLDEMVRIWDYSFKTALRIEDPSQHALLLCESHNAAVSGSVRTRSAEILFEDVHVGSLCMAPSALLSVLLTEKESGLCIDGGFHSTSVSSVIEGRVHRDLCATTRRAGHFVTDQLVRLLNGRGYSFDCRKNYDWDIVNDCKEKLCSILPTASHESYPVLGGRVDVFCSTHGYERSYELPDGQVIALDSELFHAYEHIYRPLDDRTQCLSWDAQRLLWLAHREPGSPLASLPADLIRYLIKLGQFPMPTIPEVVERVGSITPSLLENIVLSGRTMFARGTEERLKAELEHRFPDRRRFIRLSYPLDVVLASPTEQPGVRFISRDTGPKVSCAWSGGALLAQRPSVFLSKADYEESGSQLVHSRCNFFTSG
jgi:actin-related protein